MGDNIQGYYNNLKEGSRINFCDCRTVGHAHCTCTNKFSLIFVGGKFRDCQVNHKNITKISIQRKLATFHTVYAEFSVETI